MSDAGEKTAACLIIGDEILTGKVHDTNSHTLAKVLWRQGVRLNRVEVVPDDVDVIVEAVQRLSASRTWVFTSGGIGQTHDDVTFEAVAQEFGRDLVPHEPTLKLMQAHYAKRRPGWELNDARRRMAMFPAGADVWEAGNRWVSLVVVDNVCVLPGIPSLFEAMLESVADRFVGRPHHRARVLTRRAEGDIADALTRIQDANPDIAIGSYPQHDDDGARVMLTLEGPDKTSVEQVAKQVAKEVDGQLMDSASPSESA